MPIIDIRAHGGQFGGGIRAKTDETILRVVKTLSVTGHYGGNRSDYNDEADGLLFVAYNNPTGANYQVKCYDRNLNLKFETNNLSGFIDSVARDNTHFYASRAQALWKFPIVSSGKPSPVWFYAIPNNQSYPVLRVRYGKVYGINNYLLRIEVISSSGQLEDTIPITASATCMEMDKDGFLYIYDSNRELYKLDPVTKQKVWSVTGLVYNGSFPSVLKQSENYIFAITTNSYITKIDKQTGAVIGTKNYYIGTLNKISFDSYGNSFLWQGSVSGVSYSGKESYEGNLYSQANVTLEDVYGVKKPYSVGSMIQVLDFYYALRG